VQYLRPEQRSGHDIALTVNLDAGVEVEKVESRNHQIKVKRESPRRAAVVLDPADNVPNRDFVLRYKVAGEQTKSGLLAQKDEKGQGYFTLMLIPPNDLAGLPPRPLEMVFTLDVSGSMNGAPIEQSKAAMRYALTQMGPDDTFQVVQFASGANRLSERPLPATPENVRRALAYIDRTRGAGGTMMLEGIRASLDAPHDESRLRFVSFLTDGYIGNEAEIFRAVKSALGPARVFSFGVGSAPNRYLLDGLARNGRGAVAYLGLNDDATDVMAHFYQRIRRPALTHVQVDWGGMQVSDVFPREIPDLFVGRPVVLTGKFAGNADGKSIRVRGRVGNEVQSVEVPVRTRRGASTARRCRRVGAHEDRRPRRRGGLAGNADVAARSGRSRWSTGSCRRSPRSSPSTPHPTAGSFGTTVGVPVPVPQGVRYETAVQHAPGVDADGVTNEDRGRGGAMSTSALPGSCALACRLLCALRPSSLPMPRARARACKPPNDRYKPPFAHGAGPAGQRA
jgi:Ca-activated chloride channel family protein